MMKTGARNAVQRLLWHTNDLASRIGVFVLPNHYYTPIANTRALAKSQAIWAKPIPMYGVEMDVTAQVAWLKAEIAPYEPEYRGNQPYSEGVRKRLRARLRLCRSAMSPWGAPPSEAQASD